MGIALIFLAAVALVCATVLIYQHRAFSDTMYAEVREQIKATQKAVAQINAWQLQIAAYLKIELAKPKEKEQADKAGK